MPSSYPALLLYPDTLSQSKSIFLAAKDLVDNIQYVLNPGEDNTLIMQGLGRGTQETAYFTKDTLNYSGYKFIKTDEMQAKRSFASSQASTLKSAEAVVNDLKKRILKDKSF
jgi:hypothetical protein